MGDERFSYYKVYALGRVTADAKFVKILGKIRQILGENSNKSILWKILKKLFKNLSEF